MSKRGALSRVFYDEDDYRLLEIVNKIILPNARSFCRLRGSNHSGREFIQGDTRAQFQEDFQEAMAKTCDSQGVEVIQALITKIRPPEKIAERTAHDRAHC